MREFHESPVNSVMHYVRYTRNQGESYSTCSTDTLEDLNERQKQV